MWVTTVFAWLCWSSVVRAVGCPVINVEVFDDDSCGGTGTVVQVQNASIAYYGPFGSVRRGHATDRAWDINCLTISFNFDKDTDSFSTESAWNSYTVPSGDAFDPNCLSVVQDGVYPQNLTTVCNMDGAPINCKGPNTGNGHGAGGFNGGGSSSSTSQPTKPTTTTSPITSPPITSPTNTKIPNPFLIIAVSSASAAVAEASRSVSALSADPTSSAAAQAAEDRLESALVANQDASNEASKYSAQSILIHLSDVAAALLAAAAAAIAAEESTTVASAAAVAEAFGPAVDAAAAAAAAAANPIDDPAPDDTKPPTSTPTTSDAPCTECVECADATLAQISPTPDPGPGTATSLSNVAAATKRAVPAQTAAILDISPSNGHSLEDNADDWSHPLTLNKRANDRYGTSCSQQYAVPSYESYHSNGVGNPYSPLYNYYSGNVCGKWTFNLVSASSNALLPVAPAGALYPSRSYVTEHVFEIQSVQKFLDYARTVDPLLLSLYTGSAVDFCQGFGSLVYSKVAFVPASVYDTSVYSPMQQVYNALEGSASSTNPTSEFVYLESRLNGLKAVFFGGGNPALYVGYRDNLAEVSRTFMLAAYLQSGPPANIYRTVSDRIRSQWIRFGQACNASSIPAYQAIGNVPWADLYDEWEGQYLTEIGNAMQKYATAGMAKASTQIQAILTNAAVPVGERRALGLFKLRARIQYLQGITTDSTFSLRGLQNR